MADEPRAPLAEEELLSDDEESPKSEEEPPTHAIAERVAVEVQPYQEADERADAVSVDTPSSSSSQRTLSGIESLPSDPIIINPKALNLSPVRRASIANFLKRKPSRSEGEEPDQLSDSSDAPPPDKQTVISSSADLTRDRRLEGRPDLLPIKLPQNVEANYLVVKLTRANRDPEVIVRGRAGPAPRGCTVVVADNYLDTFLYGEVSYELERCTVVGHEVVGGGQVKVSHSHKVVIVYEKDGAKLELDKGRSKQAEMLVDLIHTEGFHLATTETDPTMREKPYTVYYVNKDKECFNCSEHIAGARLGPPPLDMYNPQGA